MPAHACRTAERRVAGGGGGRSTCGETSADGQRPDSGTRRGRRPRDATRMAARQRPDRQQGRLCGRRVRRVRGACRPRRRPRPRALDRDQRLPGASRGVRPAGGGHRRGPRPALRVGPTAPGPARDGRARRLAVRLLYARVHLLDGGRVLPAGPAARRPGRRAERARARQRARRRGRARAERVRPARAVRQPVPLHRVPADPGRGLRPRPAGGRRPVADPPGRARPGARRHHDHQQPGPLRPPR